ncbi:tetratricopeptide repeat protein [Paenibacillus zeisoli]|uniref:Tetratricopeptide repeat protein n=1 Tax=Paenibacillus zeisoli TaxID=2496267 RepID=A0A3S1D3M9_9BACL|nr:tetratricopeptide repeat protein [Paenibacillus zeisoli]RUT28143.1 tetratricopeptide repeat protein [Paenibacillus zeisoli]
MSKFLLFSALWWLVGNPFLALIILLAIIYVLDRQFVGVFPSVTRPIRRMRSISSLRQQLAMNHHDISAKRDLARLLLERKKFNEAYSLLKEMGPSSEESAEYWDDLGNAALGLGQVEEAEIHMLHALKLNERVRYGQPYLKLAAVYQNRDAEKSISYAEKFSLIHSSSSEAYYLLGNVYQSLNRQSEARKAYTESISIYRSLPKYKKRHERRWALRSWIKRLKL